MKLSLDHGNAEYRVTAYEPGRISINREVYETSLILTPWQLDTGWPPATVAELEARHLEPLTALEPELVLLGTGERLVFPDRSLLVALIGAGIGVEVMDTAAACRTFNVVMAEDRRVVAALLPR